MGWWTLHPRYVPTSWNQVNLVTKALTRVHYHSLQTTLVQFWFCDTVSYPAGRCHHHRGRQSTKVFLTMFCEQCALKYFCLNQHCTLPSICLKSQPILLYRADKPTTSIFIDEGWTSNTSWFQPVIQSRSSQQQTNCWQASLFLRCSSQDITICPLWTTFMPVDFLIYAKIILIHPYKPTSPVGIQSHTGQWS